MSENVNPSFGDEDDDDIFVNGVLIDPESVDSAIDALARDEAGATEGYGEGRTQRQNCKLQTGHCKFEI
jgi:hypothetical protein